jgi:hypothetical protein
MCFRTRTVLDKITRMPKKDISRERKLELMADPSLAVGWREKIYCANERQAAMRILAYELSRVVKYDVARYESSLERAERRGEPPPQKPHPLLKHTEELQRLLRRVANAENLLQDADYGEVVLRRLLSVHRVTTQQDEGFYSVTVAVTEGQGIQTIPCGTETVAMIVAILELGFRDWEKKKEAAEKEKRAEKRENYEPNLPSI